MKRLLTLIGFVFLLLSFATYNSPFGLTMAEPFGPYLNDVFPDVSPRSGDWVVENAFPNLTFADPIGMEELPDQSGFFIAGKQGYLWLISNDPNTTEKKVVLDISDLVITGEDAGLINFILHPEFDFDQSSSKGYAYIYYPYHPTFEHGNQPRMNRLSRFTYDFDLQQFDPQSEFILIQDYDPQGFHMGGGMFFDNQGFLNFTIGDGGSLSGELFTETMQQIDKYLMGGLFRIDVDKNPTTSHPIRKQPETYPGKPSDLPETFTQGYYIPNDNPWQDENGGILEEFYGLGLRSPHRASYDPFEEKIWIGDVGKGAREEITILPKGGNAQWPFMEGNINGPLSKPANPIGIETTPKFDYARSEGVAVIGGLVYRGDKWSHVLDGYYLFADHSNGNIWSLNPVNEEVILLANLPKIGVDSKNGISSFSTDANGEIYVLNLYGQNQGNGTIQKLKLNQTTPDYIPLTLSETNAFKDLNDLEIADGIIPYQSNSPLWSDGAAKKRWIGIPNDGSFDTSAEQVVFSEFENWQFPPGTVFIKHFELPIDERNPAITKRLETRFYIVDKASIAYGLTYKWNDAGTDADLLTTEVIESYPVIKTDGSTVMQTWNYPSRLQCNSCHTANAGFVLGVNTAQLNGNLTYPNGITSNQLSTWKNLGIFANPLNINSEDKLPKSAAIDDETISEEHRIMSYMDANCSHCHRPNGVDGVFDARLSTPLFYKNLIQQFGVSHNTPFGEKMIVPKDHEASQIWIRDNSIEENKMPPIAKNTVDEKYIEVLERWINNLDENKTGPCEIQYLSALDWEGTPINAWGPMEKDRSNGEMNLDDGETMSIAGQHFSRGLGSHAHSEVSYILNAEYETFSAFIGIDDGSCADGSAIFEVLDGNKILFTSDVLKYGDPAKFISIDIAGVVNLTLKALPAGDGQKCDHANWGDANVKRCLQSGLTEITHAFAFGANEYTTESANAPEVTYTKIIQNGEQHLYTPEKGYGYTDTSGINQNSNIRDLMNEDLYNQFIGTAEGAITFRVDLPNGDYRLLLVGGDPLDISKDHIIKVRDGSTGFFSPLVDNTFLKGEHFYKVGFNDTEIPDEENIEIESAFIAPSITVTKGYIEILQSSAGVAGGDICMLEIWPDRPVAAKTPRGTGFGNIHIEAMPNPFSEELTLFVHRPAEYLSYAEVFIYDLDGRLLYQNMQMPFDRMISVELHQGWSRGAYVVNARAGDFLGSQKIIRQ